MSKVIRVLESNLPVGGVPSFPRMCLHTIPAVISGELGAAAGKPGSAQTQEDFRVQQFVVLRDYAPDHQNWSFPMSIQAI